MFPLAGDASLWRGERRLKDTAGEAVTDGRAWRLGSEPDHYCPGAGVLSRGLAALKALDLSLWQVSTPRIAGSVHRRGCRKP